MSYNWKHIKFLDGSNSYICKTEKEFERVSKEYNLIKVKENFYVAECYNEDYFLVTD